MAIEYKAGDILREDAEALVNTVNCVGVMGRGIALQFRKAWPENFKEYAAACKRGEVVPGRMFVHETGQLTNPRYIINFPTKRHWRGKSRIEDIEAGLEDLVRVIRERNIRSIAIPPLGSGLGGLDWKEVHQRIEQALRNLDNEVRIIVFEPKGAPAADKMVRAKKVPRMTPGRAALIGLMDRYLAAFLDPFITLLELHKLMYFLRETGEPSINRLHFEKGRYGPYARNLRHVLHEIEGYYISGYRDGGDDPDKILQIVPGAREEAETLLQKNLEARDNFNRVLDLIEGFETGFGLELLGTVHWVATRHGASTFDEVMRETYAWNARKRRFSKHHLGVAWDVLHEKGWLNSDNALRQHA